MNFEPEKVLDALLINGNINYLVKRKGVNTAIILKSEVVRKKWPQLLIQYFERILEIIK